MGLDVTYATKKLADIQDEYKYQQELLDRNAEVLDNDYPLVNMFETIDDNLRFSSGMVRFEYVDWSNIKRRIEGHVCLVESCEYAANIKLLTEKGDMLTIFFPAVNAVQVTVLPSE